MLKDQVALQVHSTCAILRRVTGVRHNAVARFFVCLLLAWTALDLLAPELCEAESAISSTAGSTERSPQAPHAPDDCFCCSNTVNSTIYSVTFTFSERIPVALATVRDLSAGIPRSLYHPPLAS